MVDIRRLAVWVTAPSPACHVFEGLGEVIAFLVHEDGLNIGIPLPDLEAYVADEQNWKKNGNGKSHSFSIQKGFVAVFVMRIDISPTIHIDCCSWCGENHLGGPERCD